jgi:type IV secretory pathway VirB2 component (pilin)
MTKREILKYVCAGLTVAAIMAVPGLAQSPFSTAATKVSTDMGGLIAKAGVVTAIVSTGLHYVVGHNGSHQALGKLFTAGTLMGLALPVATWIFT